MGRPQLGRLLTPSDTAPVAVVSDQFWRRNLGADPSVVGSTIRAGQVALTIIGVTTPQFRDIGRYWMADITVPLTVGLAIENASRDAASQYLLEVPLC